MRIAITGATGLLGRNFLFEVIKNNLHNLEEMEILLLGRSSNEARIRERIEDIITEDGALYLSLSDYEFEDIKTAIFSSIKCVNMDIDAPKMGISTDDFNMLKREPIDVFFHIAALSDFRDSPKVVEALKRINFNGTKQILDLISLLKVDKFYYTSSAYSCGETAGDINPDYINLNQGFRNPYERSKLETEVLVRERSKETGLKCKFFRPSTISGRLMEDPAGSANKFDVFYSWAAFFLHLKTKQLDAIDYSTPVTLDARILFNPYSGLNIVPADYAAKVMYSIFVNELSHEAFHIVNDSETLHKLYIPLMLEALNIKGVKHVGSIPVDMNPLEKLYYKSVGKIFTPYITSKPMLFNTDNIRGMLENTGLSCPEIDEDNFMILMEYAKSNNFGIKEKVCV